MPLIRSGEGVITQINVFTVSPENQQALIDLVQNAARFCEPDSGMGFGKHS
jgi:hypothetical protein